MNASKPSAYGPAPGPPVNPKRCENCGVILTDEWVGQAPRTDGYLCGPCHRGLPMLGDPAAEAVSTRKDAEYLDRVSAAERTELLHRDLRDAGR